MRALLKKTFRLRIDWTQDISYGLLNLYAENMAITTSKKVAFIQQQKKSSHEHNFFIFVLSEDTGRLSGLRGSDNESEEE